MERMSRLLFILYGLIPIIHSAQVNRKHYSRSETGISSIKREQTVSWLPVNSETINNKAEVKKVNNSLIPIDNVQEQNLNKTNFEPVSIPMTEEILDLEFDYRENAKMDIVSLSRLQAPYLNEMQAIAQLNDGRIIYGGKDVICIYDGYKMQVYNSTSDYFFEEIFSIVVDKENRAWIASNAGISYFKAGKFYKASNLDVGKVWNYWVNIKNDLYVATYNQGIYILHNDYTEHIYKEGKIDEVLDFHQSEDGTLYYGLDNGLAQKINNQWFEYPFGKIKGSIRSFLEVGDRLFIGTFQDGVYFLEDGEVFHLEIGARKNASVYNLQLVDDQIWIPMYSSGIVVLNKDFSYYEVNREDGLVGNSIIKVFLDTYGNIWCTDLFYGLSKIQDLKIKPLLPKEEEFVFRKEQNINDTLWFFGANSSIYRKIKENLFRLDFKGDGFLLTGDAISGDEAVLSSYNQGKQVYKNNRIYTYDSKEHDSQGTFLLPTYGNNGEVYYTNHPEEIRMFYHDSVFNLSDLSDFKGKRLKDIVANDSREVCVRFENSIAFITPSDYVIVNEKNGLLSSWIYDVIPWGKGFCVLTDKGAQIFSEGALKKNYSISILSQGKNAYAKQISQDKILVKSETEIFILHLTDKPKIEVLDYNKGSYLVGLWLTETDSTKIQLRKEGRIYSFDHFAKIPGDANPQITLDLVSVNSKQKVGDIIVSQDDKISFKVSVVSLSGKGELKYRLTSMKNKVIEGTTLGREIVFNNLLKGNYQLELFHESNGKMSNIINLQITVQPFWYQTGWFYSALVLLVLSVLFVYIRLRLKKSAKRQLELQRLVEEKTVALQNEKLLVESELHEKEILLKEVNHRVKNNMQMASSLLHLQAGKSDSEIEKAALKLASERIKSLSLAHQNLYQSEDYANLKLKEYIALLVENLTRNSNVKCTLNVDTNLSMGIEKAQSLGLVINELLTNSIKHAWMRDETNKEIRINIVQVAQKGELTYEDNGRGFPEDFDMEQTKSLGFTLIKSFVSRRLKGELEILRNQRNTLKITFVL